MKLILVVAFPHRLPSMVPRKKQQQILSATQPCYVADLIAKNWFSSILLFPGYHHSWLWISQPGRIGWVIRSVAFFQLLKIINFGMEDLPLNSHVSSISWIYIIFLWRTNEPKDDLKASVFSPLMMFQGSPLKVRGALREKNDIVASWGGGGSNPVPFSKPKFSRSWNHLDMATENRLKTHN